MSERHWGEVEVEPRSHVYALIALVAGLLIGVAWVGAMFAYVTIGREDPMTWYVVGCMAMLVGWRLVHAVLKRVAERYRGAGQ